MKKPNSSSFACTHQKTFYKTSESSILYKALFFPLFLIGVLTLQAQTDKVSDNPICKDTSYRVQFAEDTFHLYCEHIINTSDGNILMAGMRVVSYSPYQLVGSAIKCKPDGDTIWTRDFSDAVNHFAFQYTNAFELSDHSILLVGALDLPVPVNSRTDLVLTHLNANGDFIWQRSFVSYYLNNNDSTSRTLVITDAKNGADGSIYLCGGITRYGGSRESLLAKLSSNGSLVWNKSIGMIEGNSKFVGLSIFDDHIQAFGSCDEQNLFAMSFSTSTGDTLISKKWAVPFSYSDQFYRSMLPYGAIQTINHNTVIYGRTYGDFSYINNGPRPHMATVEVSPSLDIVNASIFKAGAEVNSSYITVYEDGTAAYYMDFGPYNGISAVFGNIQKGQVVKERYLQPTPIPRYTTSNFVQLKDGGDAFAQTVAINGSAYVSGIELLTLHKNDMPGKCFGTDTSLITTEHQQWQVIFANIDSVSTHAMAEVFHNDLLPSANRLHIVNSCSQQSFCDSFKLLPSARLLCPGTTLTIQYLKNKECGSKPLWSYDTTNIKSFSYLNDSTVQVKFAGAYNGFIAGELTGCASVKDSVMIQVLQTPQSLNLGPDTTLCAGNTIVLNAHKGYASYEWQNGSTDSVFTVSQPGSYYIATADACGNSYHDTVTVSAHEPIALDLGADRTKCNADTIQLNAPAGFINYAWSNSYNASSTIAQDVVVNPMIDTYYYLKAEKTPGCFAYDTVHVTVHTSPRLELGADKSFCSGDSTIFDAGSGFTQYLWSTGATSEQLIIKNSGTYSLIASTALGCKSFDTVKVNVFSNPVVNLDKSNSLCSGTTRSLDAGKYSSYLWNNGSTARYLSVNSTGSYYVTVTDNSGCKGSDTTTITTLLAEPSNFLAHDTSICSFGSLVIQPIKNFRSYLWNTGVSSSSITITTPGTYWLQVQDGNQCSGKDSIVVSPKECMEGLYVPTAFTPNNDGKNDVFRPLLFGKVKRFSFTIYNRWGQVVFQTHELQKGWNGQVSGVDQQSNVFIWVCSYQLENGQPKAQKGTVMLVR